MLAPLSLTQVSARRRMLTAGRATLSQREGENARAYQH